MSQLPTPSAESNKQETAHTQPSSSRERSIASLLTAASEHTQSLIRNEIALAKLTFTQKVTKIGVGAVLLGAAAFFAVFAFLFFLHTAVRALALVLPLWASFLIVAAILLLIALILALVGVYFLKRSQKHSYNPKERAQADIAEVKKGLNR